MRVGEIMEKMMIDIDKDPAFDLKNYVCREERIEEIRRLNENAEIYLCTNFLASSDDFQNAKICKERFDFLFRTFPFIPPKRFAFTKAKNLFKRELNPEIYRDERTKKVLLLDIDEVFWFSNFLRLINEFLHTDYKHDDFTDYYIDEVAIPKERFSEFKDFQSTRSLFDDAELIPGSLEALRRLDEYFDIYPYTDSIDPLDVAASGKNFEDKFLNLRKLLPFIPPERYVFTGSKQLLDGDVQVDDRLKNLDPDIPIRILFPSYHNKDTSPEVLKEENVQRAGYDYRTGWNEVMHILESMEEIPVEKRI
ncbi:MAG TPA: hypothetical protein DCY94_02375 [Firmicutes bacterium]|nr:hypothetical protein [Bacillota bacterium]